MLFRRRARASGVAASVPSSAGASARRHDVHRLRLRHDDQPFQPVLATRDVHSRLYTESVVPMSRKRNDDNHRDARAFGVPEFLAHLRRCASTGLPIPYVVPVRRGRGLFAEVLPQRVTRCARKRICQVCGRPVTPPFVFVRVRDDGNGVGPPCHEDCARWAANTCPAVRRSPEAALIFANDYDALVVADMTWLVQAVDVVRIEAMTYREGSRPRAGS